MKKLILVALLLQTVIYPTLPGTDIRDYNQPGVRIERNGNAYPTLPGSNIRDYSRPGFKIDEVTIDRYRGHNPGRTWR